MKKLLFLLMTCALAVHCSSSDSVDDPGPGSDPDEYTWGGDTEDDPDATTYYFDDEIAGAEYTSLNTVQQIELLLDKIDAGDIIMFGANVYNITEDLDLTKSVVLRGVGEYPVIPSNYKLASEVAGHGTIETEFVISNLKNINVRANDIKLNHLTLTGYTTTTTSATIEMIGANTSNLQLDNVFFNSGKYLLSPRDAMPHGLKCRYVSFSESYNRGFFVNRSYDHEFSEIYTYRSYMDVTKVEKMEFYRCYFSVQDPDVKDTRGISIDAGNTENPSILDFDEMQVRECYFYDIGFASSKCKNFQIIDCEFYLDKLFDAPFHIEEFSGEALIKGNTFKCYNFSEVISHVYDNSIVEDNVVIGIAGGFMSGNYCEGMTVRNNDCSAMSSSSAINIWMTNRGSRDISITGNKFPSSATISVRATTEYANTINVSGNSGGSGGYTNCAGYKDPLTDGALYGIKNKGTGQYLRATSVNGRVELVEATSFDEYCYWRVTKVWPFMYNVYNEKLDTYLFIEKDTEGYSDEASAIAAKIPLQTKQFADGLRLPVWDFTSQAAGGSIIGPGGGNDGCVGIDVSDRTRLYCHKRADGRDASTVDEVDLLWTFQILEQ